MASFAHMINTITTTKRDALNKVESKREQWFEPDSLNQLDSAFLGGCPRHPFTYTRTHTRTQATDVAQSIFYMHTNRTF